MSDKRNMITLWGTLLTLLLFVQPAQAHSWWGWSQHSFHHIRYPYPRYGSVEVVLPGGFVSVVLGGSRYYYCDGIFYRRANRGYVVIAPPVGAVVEILPVECHMVIVNGVTYYTINGIYYQHTRRGYQVVLQPNMAAVVQQPVTVVEHTKGTLVSPIQNNNEEAFTVNVPNVRGGYTAVILKRLGSGFVGPQGEYYPEFPRVEQLKVMYAK